MNHGSFMLTPLKASLYNCSSDHDHGPIAQSVEHLTFNQGVEGSNPSGPTKEYLVFCGFEQPSHFFRCYFSATFK
jgi:hypothetical protein